AGVHGTGGIRAVGSAAADPEREVGPARAAGPGSFGLWRQRLRGARWEDRDYLGADLVRGAADRARGTAGPLLRDRRSFAVSREIDGADAATGIVCRHPHAVCTAHIG